MKQVRKYVSNPNEIKKIFKLFPDPQIKLTRHKHNLWPYYYRDYEQLNYFTDLIKNNGLIDVTFDFIYIMHKYPFSEITNKCKQRLELLKNTTDNKLIHILWEIIEPNGRIILRPLENYIKNKIPGSVYNLTEMYFIYSLLIYCYGVDFMPIFNDNEIRYM